VKMRACRRCHRQLPLETYRPQGRGHSHTCPDCEAKRKPREYPPDSEVSLLGVLTEIRDLLRSPTCSRCGGKGARMGNPPKHEGC
jgi:hypothetical protein